MARPEFSWFPDVGSTSEIEPNVNATKFGDGYELRTSSAINFIAEKWQLKFTRAVDEATEIDQFLRARAAKEAFDWVTPEGNAGTYVCRKWNKSRMKGGAMEISCTFEQVFEY